MFKYHVDKERLLCGLNLLSELQFFLPSSVDCFSGPPEFFSISSHQTQSLQIYSLFHYLCPGPEPSKSAHCLHGEFWMFQLMLKTLYRSLGLIQWSFHPVLPSGNLWSHLEVPCISPQRRVVHSCILTLVLSVSSFSFFCFFIINFLLIIWSFKTSLTWPFFWAPFPD